MATAFCAAAHPALFASAPGPPAKGFPKCVIATPQYATPQLGSAWAAASKVFCASALQPTGNCTDPTEWSSCLCSWALTAEGSRTARLSAMDKAGFITISNGIRTPLDKGAAHPSQPASCAVHYEHDGIRNPTA